MKSYFKIFKFISDKKLENNLILDYKEVLTCMKRQAYKGAVVLAGGIVEAILIDKALVLPTDKGKVLEEKYYELSGERSTIEKMELSHLIVALTDMRIITSPQAGRSDVLRDYRNLIHPYKKGERPTKADAISVKKLLDDLVKEFGTDDKPEIEDINKASSFLTHPAWRKKREKPEYKEILKLFHQKGGVVSFKEFLELPSFKDKQNPSKSLIANLTYLKQCGMCNYDVDSWRGYPVKRYESWLMNEAVTAMLKNTLKGTEA